MGKFDAALGKFVRMLLLYGSYRVSPIDRERFKTDRKARLRLSEQQSQTYKFNSNLKRILQDKSVDWKVVWNLKHLAYLIKRQHLAGNKFLFCILLQFFLLFYLLFKCIFHLLKTRHNEELAEYYDKQYCFPKLFHSYPNQFQFYGLCLTVYLYSLVIRLDATIKLIRISILNQKHYKEFYITQVNCSYMDLTSDVTVKQLLQLMRNSLIHYLQIGRNPLTRSAHTKIRALKTMSEFDKSDMIYYRNAIDFNECHKLNSKNVANFKYRTLGHNNWHYTMPVHRMDSFELALFEFFLKIGILTLGLFIFLVLANFFIFEVRATLPEHNLTWLDLLASPLNLLSKPCRLVRFLDTAGMVFVQLPNQMDAAAFCLDAIVLLSRIRKISKCFEDCLNVCRLGVYLIHSNCDTIQTKIDRKELNKYVRQLSNLTKILSYEFLDIKKAHSSYLNLMILSSGFCLAQCAIIIIRTDFFAVRFNCSAIAVALCVPLFTVPIYCVMIDNMVSTPTKLRPATKVVPAN